MCLLEGISLVQQLSLILLSSTAQTIPSLVPQVRVASAGYLFPARDPTILVV